MERSVGEGASTANQMCWKGTIGGKIMTLEATYEGCRSTIQ